MMADAPVVLAERLGGLRESLPDLELLVLFGSVATGRARPRSDLDLAVSCEGPADLDAVYMALAGGLRTDRLDLVDLRRAGPLLAFQDLARQLAPSAGLRNRLVHEYETIDDAKVLAAIGTMLELYPRFVEAVESFLTKSGL